MSHYEHGAFIAPDHIPDEAPVFRQPVYGLVEIVPTVRYDDSVGSGLAVDFYRCRDGIACVHEWSTLDAAHLTQYMTEPDDDYLWTPATPAAWAVFAEICAQVAAMVESRGRADIERATQIMQRARHGARREARMISIHLRQIPDPTRPT